MRVAGPRVVTRPEWEIHSHQLRVWNSPAGILVVVAGRRGGKSELAMMWILALAYDLSRQGVSGIFWIVAPNYKLTRPLWRKLMRIAPPGWITAKYGTDRRPGSIVVGDRCTIEFHSADDPETLVAEGLNGLVVDECGIVKERAWSESLMATLIDYGAPAFLCGTPKGRNWFYRMYVSGQDAAQPDIESFTWTSYENPFIEEKEITRLAQTMPQRTYEQEILGIFLDDEGAVFRGVRKCQDVNLRVMPGWMPTEMKDRPKTRILGVDLAKHHDFTVIHGLDADGRTTYWDRFRELDWPVQKARIKQAASLTGARIILDSTGVGDPIYDDLRHAGVKIQQGFKFTNQSKAQIVNGLSIAIEQRDVTLHDEPVLVNELEQYEYETTPSGVTRYNAPEGAHDDCVMALALAYHGLGRSVGPIEVVHF